jgi:hypothetical protein
MRRKVKKPLPAPNPAIRQIRQAIAAMDLVCAGTVLKRWKLCGRPNCCCAQDPAARHGPYYEWSRRQDGRLRHSLLTPQQAEQMVRAIKNQRQILALLRRWSLETARTIMPRNQAN